MWNIVCEEDVVYATTGCTRLLALLPELLNRDHLLETPLLSVRRGNESIFNDNVWPTTSHLRRPAVCLFGRDSSRSLRYMGSQRHGRKGPHIVKVGDLTRLGGWKGHGRRIRRFRGAKLTPE